MAAFTPGISAILLAWLLVSGKLFSFHYIGNEMDVLPFARQFVEAHWLPHDWFLNLEMPYRQAFNLVIGPLISWFGFEYGAFIGRLLVYLLFAIAISVLFETLHIRLWFGLLALFFFLQAQSLVAGEWIVGGVDTKTIAYAFVLLSLASFIRKRYRLAFTFAGVAISFHFLVGIYALFCLIAAILLSPNWRSEWRRIIRCSWPLFITGVLGWRAMIMQFLPQGDVNAAQAWGIYVLYRVPHHVLPSAWQGSSWIVKLTLATCLFLAVFITQRSAPARFIASFSLGSILLFLFGLAIYAWGPLHLLRFYWFRFPDVIVPLMSGVLITLTLNDFVAGTVSLPFLSDRARIWMQAAMNRGAVLLASAVLLLVMIQTVHRLQAEYRLFENPGGEIPIQPVWEWIAENTPEQSLFLVDPRASDFYIHAQRGMFVSFKLCPQTAADIFEWYRRIKLCNGDRFPVSNGYNAEQELSSNFYHLDESLIHQIAQRYGISYYVGLSAQNLTFDRVYSESGYTVYKIGPPDQIQDQ